MSKGDRVAQLILERITTPDVVEARPSRAQSVSCMCSRFPLRVWPRGALTRLCFVYRAHQVEDLDDTTRGAGGFGSTGVAAKA